VTSRIKQIKAPARVASCRGKLCMLMKRNPTTQQQEHLMLTSQSIKQRRLSHVDTLQRKP
jgi:hypothetical protein